VDEVDDPAAASDAVSPRRHRRLRVTALMVATVLVLGAVALYRTDLAVEALERYAGPASRFVEVEGMAVHYRDRGEGPAVLLLHGSSSSLHTWEDWSDRLTPTHRVVAVDLPGHGLTGPHPEGRYATRDTVAFLDAFAEAIDLDRFALVGSSMGGRIAWAYTVLHPERVDGLVLVSAAGFPADGPPRLVYRLARLPAVGAVMTRLTPRWLIAAQLRSAVADPDALLDTDIDRYADLLRREGNRDAVRTRLLTDPDDEDLRGRLAEIAIPTLVLWGARDTWVPVAHADRFAAAIPDVQVVVYPELGHLPMEEDPDGTIGDLSRFLAELGR
jgi:pimeloyl-ACP methyl ester carboxylesterase